MFKQPWAIVQPDAMLMPGQKFYIVPITTIRKLQMISLKNPSSRLEDVDKTSQSHGRHEGVAGVLLQSCNLLAWNHRANRALKMILRVCFTCLVQRRTNKDGNRDLSRETKTSGSWGSCEAKKSLCKKATEESPKRLFTSIEYWQPDLQSVNEEWRGYKKSTIE